VTVSEYDFEELLIYREALIRLRRDMSEVMQTEEAALLAGEVAGIAKHALDRGERLRAGGPEHEFIEWLIRLDDPEDVLAREERRVLTLTEIIDRARKALPYDPVVPPDAEDPLGG
jgi:hypothetical protein